MSRSCNCPDPRYLNEVVYLNKCGSDLCKRIQDNMLNGTPLPTIIIEEEEEEVSDGW